MGNLPVPNSIGKMNSETCAHYMYIKCTTGMFHIVVYCVIIVVVVFLQPPTLGPTSPNLPGFTALERDPASGQSFPGDSDIAVVQFASSKVNAAGEIISIGCAVVKKNPCLEA